MAKLSIGDLDKILSQLSTLKNEVKSELGKYKDEQKANPTTDPVVSFDFAELLLNLTTTNNVLHSAQSQEETLETSINNTQELTGNSNNNESEGA